MEPCGELTLDTLWLWPWLWLRLWLWLALWLESASCLLLLDGIRVGLLRGRWRGRCRMVVGGRGPLAGDCGVDGVRRRVHLVISWWMPVLGGKNGHGLCGRAQEGCTPSFGMRRPSWTSSPSLCTTSRVREETERSDHGCRQSVVSSSRTNELGPFRKKREREKTKLGARGEKGAGDRAQQRREGGDGRRQQRRGD